MRETGQFVTEMKWMGKIFYKVDLRAEGIFGLAKGGIWKNQGLLVMSGFLPHKIGAPQLCFSASLKLVG